MTEQRIFRSAEQIKLDVLREECVGLLAECTEPQRALFARVFPTWPDKVTEHQLENALGILQRTIRKNDRKAAESAAPAREPKGEV